MKEFDDILKIVGDFGLYQKFQLFFFVMFCGLTSFHQLGNTFFSASDGHYCRVYDNQTYMKDSPVKNCTIPYTLDGNTVVWDKCNRYDVNVSSEDDPSEDICFPRGNDTLSCDQGWVYDKTWYENTVVFEFDLVCTKDWMKQLSKSIFPLGNIIGVLVFGQIADTFGRRVSMTISLILTVATSIATAFSPNYAFFIFGQLLLGLFPLAFLMSCQVSITEIVGPKYRARCLAVGHVNWCIVMIILGLVAWMIDGNWRQLQLIIGLSWAAFLPYLIVMTESPRWLMQKHRYDKCYKIMKRFAKFNKTTVPDDIFEKGKTTASELTGKTDTEKERKYTLLDLLRSPILRIRTLIICFNWFSCGFMYYGISLNTDRIGENPYRTFIFSGVVEIPGRLLAWWFVGYFGRRWSLGLFQVMGGLALVLSGFPENDTVSTSIAMVAKFCTSAVFTICYVYSVELYPTVVRGIGMALSSTSAGIANIISPFIILLSVYWTPLPFVTIGITSVFAGLVVPILPETKNENLPGTIEEGELFGRAKQKQRGSIKTEHVEDEERQTLLPKSASTSKANENQDKNAYGVFHHEPSLDTVF